MSNDFHASGGPHFIYRKINQYEFKDDHLLLFREDSRDLVFGNDSKFYGNVKNIEEFLNSLAEPLKSNVVEALKKKKEW